MYAYLPVKISVKTWGTKDVAAWNLNWILML